ncbi:MAG TPA: hypothetical protein VMW64_00995 [Dehalococcoidia bacterium]|nr:hypothetical protein [Dehalococcoidia bacterium]
MGDYLKLKNGDSIKIGTCGDNQYMRHDEALRFWHLDVSDQMTGNLKYLDALWRFPYPQEDHATLEDICRRSMFYTTTFTVPKECLSQDHDEICVHVQAQNDNGWGINRLIPCPLSKDDKVYGANVASPIVQIYGERYDSEGHPRTIFRCGYCGKPFSLGQDEIEAYRQAFIKYHTRYVAGENICPDWAVETAARFSAANEE